LESNDLKPTVITIVLNFVLSHKCAMLCIFETIASTRVARLLLSYEEGFNDQ